MGCIGNVEVEPGLWVVVVRPSRLVERRAGAHESECALSIRTERHARSNLAEARGRLVDLDFDVGAGLLSVDESYGG